MKRVTKNPITTIAGLVIIAASLAYIFVKADATWTEAGIGIASGTTLLFMTDPSSLKSK